MAEKREQEVIDFRHIIKKLWDSRKLFYKSWVIAFIVSSALILPVPRTYTCDVELAPETETPAIGGGTLGSLAASFGVDLNTAMTSDAIQPTFYPDLIESNDFIINLLKIKVSTEDGELTTNYYDYLCNHQKRSFWVVPFSWIKSTVVSIFSSDDEKGGKELDPFRLTKKEFDITEQVRNNIDCDIDKRTDAITITVRDQDPLVCAQMADSVMHRLQSFITDYRTSKSRIDLVYYKKLAANAKQDYEKARRLYGSYADANNDIVLESFRAKQTDLENDMQLKYNTYTVLMTQLQAATAKVQERTPAFTTIQGATVPVKPTGPKRMLFVLAMLLFTTMGVAGYVVKDDFK